MTWQIDHAHSHILFTVRHMMISKVRGRFDAFRGEINFDENNPEQTMVSVEIDANSISTRESQRDGHLKSPDFLDVENYPTLTFQGKRVEQTGAQTGKLIGDLTIRGITREVSLAVDYAGTAQSPWGATSAGFSAEATIDRRDWNLTWNQALETGGLLVGNDIKIEIELELVKQPEAVIG
ncbi:MAG: YceI family protein [Anaerolineales bacterium]|nr:YceI family protein [Anaerolineales bacterium]MCB8953576.1 YceI family protein [Ardenticatenales bacterium]